MWKRRRVALALGAAFIFAIYGSQLPGCLRAQLPKTGRVVDKFSGEGVPNAAVIVVEKHVAVGGFPFPRESISFAYRELTHTDERGYFRSSTHFSDLEFDSYMPCGLFRWECSEQVFVTALKPPYVAINAMPFISENPPPVAERFFEPASERWVDTGTILMDASPHDIWQLARYYRLIASLGIRTTRIGEDLSPEAVRFIKEPVHQYFTSQVCHLYPEDELSSEQVRNAAAFIDHGIHTNHQTSKLVPTEFVQELYAAAPEGFDRDAPRGWIQYKPSYVGFRAGTVCDLMSKIGVSK